MKNKQLSLFDKPPAQAILYEELLEAYYNCRHTKRSTINALAFELDYETKLVNLLAEINEHRYWPGRSVTFIVNKPVLREIFAASFRDRVVHHLIINKLNPYFEKWFIYDSYACRKDRGTLFGVRRVERFIRSCSHNYTQDCYVLKLDISGFFMNIDKQLLWLKLDKFISKRYEGDNTQLLRELCQRVVQHDPTKQYIVRGQKSDWNDLPLNKSLFSTPSGYGIPIGNLTSQVFANFYMTFFDHYIKHDLGVRYYGRYVDDFILVHQSKAYLLDMTKKIDNFLSVELHLQLHPHKRYLQHYSRGVSFVGAMIKPGRIYANHRLRANFYATIMRHNVVVRDHKPSAKEINDFITSINSYLGHLRWQQTFTMRKKMIWKHVSVYWCRHVKLDKNATALKKRWHFGNFGSKARTGRR